jgi:hypothetical protein
MSYSGVAMNDPSNGSLLLQLQNSWLRARDDARILSPPEPMAAFAAAAMLPERPPPPP